MQTDTTPTTPRRFRLAFGATLDDQRAVDAAVSRLRHEARTFLEITGVIGETESRASYEDPMGFVNRPEAFAELERIGAAHNWTIDDAKTIVAEIDAAVAELEKNRPIKDARKTPEEMQAIRAKNEAKAEAERIRQEQQNREYAERRAQEDAERTEIEKTANLGDPTAETMKTDPTRHYVVIQLVCDQSAPQFDHYDRDHGITGDYILAEITHGARTEAKMRAAVRACPELARLNWTYHKGGQWSSPKLEAAYPGRPTYKGRPVYARYQVTIAGGKYLHARPSKWYGTIPDEPTHSSTSSATTTAGTGATIRRNTAHDGIEVSFPSRPPQAAIDWLKSRGFRWSRRQGLWYARHTEARENATRAHFGEIDAETADR